MDDVNENEQDRRGASAGSTSERIAQRSDVILRLLEGESLEVLAAEGHGSVAELEAWRRRFIEGGRQALDPATPVGVAHWGQVALYRMVRQTERATRLLACKLHEMRLSLEPSPWVEISRSTAHRFAATKLGIRRGSDGRSRTAVFIRFTPSGIQRVVRGPVRFGQNGVQRR